MNQIILGALIPFIIGMLVYAVRRRASPAFLILLPLFMALGAIWAIVPDIPRMLGNTQLYLKMARDPHCDIFFWHYTIDRVEWDNVPYHWFFLVMCLALMGIAWREVFLREKLFNQTGKHAGHS
jgi:hypothetical protein